MTFAEKQEQYAKLLVKLGVNIQPEQELVVRCAAEAHLCAACCQSGI